MVHIRQRPGKAFGLLIILCAGIFNSAKSATITVNSLLDNADPTDGLCTLREALLGADLDVAVDGCGAGSGADTIVFAASLFSPPQDAGFIFLTDELVLGSESVSIEGPSDASLSLTAAAGTRVFTVDQAPTATFSLSNMLLRQGSGSIGGTMHITSGGQVELSSVSIVDSNAVSGGAIAVEPDGSLTLSIMDSHFARNSSVQAGGAIWVRPDGADVNLTIASTTFIENVSGDDGGALFIQPTNAASTVSFDIVDSIWSANEATGGVGAALFAAANADAASRMDGLIENSRFDRNRATGASPGGAVAFRGYADASNTSMTTERSTFFRNSAASGSAIFIASANTRLMSNVFATNTNAVDSTLLLSYENSTAGLDVDVEGNSFFGNETLGGSEYAEQALINLTGTSGSSFRWQGNLLFTLQGPDTANCELHTDGAMIEFYSRHNITNKTSCQFDVLDTVDTNLNPEIRLVNITHPIHEVAVILPQDSELIDTWPANDCEDLNGNPLVTHLLGDRRPGGNSAADPINGNPLTGAGCDPGAFEAPVGRLLSLEFTGAGPAAIVVEPISRECYSDCELPIADLTEVELSVIPDPGSVFEGWGGACSGTGPCQFTMTSDLTVSADFSTVPTFELTVSRLGGGDNSVTSTPSGLSCGNNCSVPFNSNSTVSLTASPDDGWEFVGFSGDCTGLTCDVLMSEDQSVTAEFTFIGYELTADVAGQGMVTSAPGNIVCPGKCSDRFTANEEVVLTATPGVGQTFAYWDSAPASLSAGKSGVCTTTATCTFFINQSYIARAVFASPVEVTTSGSGNGTVQGFDIDCPGACNSEVPADLNITLIAIPDAGSTFTGWSGACSGTGDCEIPGGSGGEVVAEFTHTLVDVLFGDGFE